MGSSGSGYSSEERSGGELSEDDALEASRSYGESINTRLRPRKDMSVAQWDAERGIAEVIVRKGKAWTTTGLTRGSLHLAHIEEAVFMVEQGSLIMRDGEKVMPLLDAYSLVATHAYGCSWDEFQAYVYLKKLGYIVGRHKIPWTSRKKGPPVVATDVAELEVQLAAINLITPKEKLCNLTSNDLPKVRILESENATQVGWSEYGDKIGTGETHHDEKQELKLMYDVHLPNTRFRKTDPGLPAFSLCITSNYPPHRAGVRALERHCEGRPVKFASVVCDHVTIYSFDVVQLSTLP